MNDNIYILIQCVFLQCRPLYTDWWWFFLSETLTAWLELLQIINCMPINFYTTVNIAWRNWKHLNGPFKPDPSVKIFFCLWISLYFNRPFWSTFQLVSTIFWMVLLMVKLFFIYKNVDCASRAYCSIIVKQTVDMCSHVHWCEGRHCLFYAWRSRPLFEFPG
jgi:hypothetical protein